MTRSGLPGSYAGTLFRSHLEARWAIFFDHLDLKWEYEPQGFDLGGGTLYLPDFAIYAACGTLWCEVKPEWDTDPEGVEKWRRFAAARPGKPASRALLLVGKPSAHGDHVVIGGDDEQDDPLKGPWEDSGNTWRPCTAGYHFDLGFETSSDASRVVDGCPEYAGGDGPERIDAAVTAALSFRFGKFGPGRAA